MSEQGGSGDAAQPSSPDDKNRSPIRVTISDGELSSLSASDLASRWRLQEIYVNSLEHRVTQQEGRYCIHKLVDHFDHTITFYDCELT